MAEESKSNKNPVIAICTIVAAVILIAVIVIVILSNKKLDDSFFVSDGTKYVLTMESDDMLGLDVSEYVPEKTHLIYFYSGDKVTDVRVYYVYENEEIAKQAAEYIKEQNEGEFKSITVDGKYVIITADRSLYDGMTAEDAKQQTELMEMLQNVDTKDIEETDEENEGEADVENDDEEAVDGTEGEVTE